MSAISQLRATTEKTITQSKRRDSRSSERRNRLDYYLNLNYPIELVREDDDYIASHPDLPGCVSYGPSPNEAVESLTEVKILWLTGRIEGGGSIPEPSVASSYSGKFVLRVPKMLHQLADFKARQQGVSLNAYISCILAGAVGFPFSEQMPRFSGAVERGRVTYGWNLSAPHEDLPWSWKSSQHHENDQLLELFVTEFADKIGTHFPDFTDKTHRHRELLLK